MLQKNNKSILFFDKNTFKVIGLFFDCPNKNFHLRGIASLTKLSTTAVNAACKRLLNFKIIEMSKKAVTKQLRNLGANMFVFPRGCFFKHTPESGNATPLRFGL